VAHADDVNLQGACLSPVTVAPSDTAGNKPAASYENLIPASAANPATGASAAPPARPGGTRIWAYRAGGNRQL
jgi:hypothetical protein